MAARNGLPWHRLRRRRGVFREHRFGDHVQTSGRSLAAADGPAPWIEAVASGMMARDLVEASAALELSPAAIEMFSAALSTYEGADVEEALHVIRREETRLFIGPDPWVENSEGTWLQRAHGVAHPIPHDQ